jgi:hypothetical protein
VQFSRPAYAQLDAHKKAEAFAHWALCVPNEELASFKAMMNWAAAFKSENSFFHAYPTAGCAIGAHFQRQERSTHPKNIDVQRNRAHDSLNKVDKHKLKGLVGRQ